MRELKLIIAASSLLFASSALADVMEFDIDAPFGFSSYSEDGINLSVVGVPAWGPDIYTAGLDNYLHIDGAYMEFDMGGSIFSLLSLDVLLDTGGDATIGSGAWSMSLGLGLLDFSAISQLQSITSFWIDTDVIDVLNNHFEIDSITTMAAIPEPGTLALLGIGLLGMGAARRKKV